MKKNRRKNHNSIKTKRLSIQDKRTVRQNRNPGKNKIIFDKLKLSIYLIDNISDTDKLKSDRLSSVLLRECGYLHKIIFLRKHRHLQALSDSPVILHSGGKYRLQSEPQSSIN